MTMLFALPLILLVVGIFFGIANGARAALTWLTWIAFVGGCTYSAFFYDHLVLAVIIFVVGFVISFWIATFGGYAQAEINSEAPAQQIIRTYERLPSQGKEALGKFAAHAARIGAAYAADRMRSSHPRTSDLLSRLSK